MRVMFNANQTFDLLDKKGPLLGRVTVEAATDDLITGTFQAGPEFPAAADLFCRFEEAANGQSLAVLEEIETAIAALGLSLSLPDGPQRQAIHDMQVWQDGDFSCRTGATASGCAFPLCGDTLETQCERGRSPLRSFGRGLIPWRLPRYPNQPHHNHDGKTCRRKAQSHHCNNPKPHLRSTRSEGPPGFLVLLGDVVSLPT